MTYVFDACAVIAYLRNEEGAEQLEQILLTPSDHSFIHALNLCEVYYDALRNADGAFTSNPVNVMADLGIVVREDMDFALWQLAGRYKADLRRISLADCFAAALTQRLDAQLLTSDHREFDPVVEAGLCPVTFFR